MSTDFHPDDYEPSHQGPLPGTQRRVCDEPAPAADTFRAIVRQYSPAEIAEHEAWVARKQAEATERTRADALNDWRAACLPRLRETDWNDPRLAREHCRRVLAWQYGPRNLVAVGRSGRGKSRALYALARRIAVDELHPTRYLLQTEITNDINRGELRGWLEKFQGLRNAPVLVWDDFGKFAAIGSRQDLLASEIEALLDYRFNRELPTLITTNARAPDFLRVFGSLRAEPISRRLTEDAVIVDFDTLL